MPQDSAAKRPEMDNVTIELEVIQAVGHALAQLPNADAQRRVLQWINDRFQPSSSPSAPRPAPDAATTDSTLGLDGLEELFEHPGFTPTMHHEAVTPEEPRLESLVHGFVSDFQRVALEWQGA